MMGGFQRPIKSESNELKHHRTDESKHWLFKKTTTIKEPNSAKGKD